jgi:hypothetical protein
MAEIYHVGINRITYRSTDFIEELSIFVDLYRPDGCREPSIFLCEMGDGLYYFGYNFCILGVYTGIFYENGVKKTSQNFRIEDRCNGGGMVVPPSFLGPNVI